MLDSRILSFGILTNRDYVDVIVWRLVALDGLTRSHVRKQIKLSKSKEESQAVFVYYIGFGLMD